MNIVLCMTLFSNAVTQFDGFFANSFASFDGNLYFSNEDGIYVYDEDSEEEVVDAFFELPMNDHGYVGRKKIRSILIDGKIEGELVVESYIDEDDKKEYSTGDISTKYGAKIAADSDQIGRYFKFRISNVDGAYFSIDKIKLTTILMPERRN